MLVRWNMRGLILKLGFSISQLARKKTLDFVRIHGTYRTLPYTVLSLAAKDSIIHNHSFTSLLNSSDVNLFDSPIDSCIYSCISVSEYKRYTLFGFIDTPSRCLIFSSLTLALLLHHCLLHPSKTQQW